MIRLEEDKKYFDRLTDSNLTLETIARIRRILLDNFSSKEDTKYYVEANEILNDIERKTWDYINGKFEEERG